MVTITVDDAIEAMQRGQHISDNWFIESKAERDAYNRYNSPDGDRYIIHDDKTITVIPRIHLSEEPEWDQLVASGAEKWFIPPEFMAIDVRMFLLAKCNSEIEFFRIEKEIQMYEDRDLMKVLKFLIYLVDTARNNNVVLGVGRGSSVASFALYLMGVHKIDSIKYDLDVEDFLR